MNNLKLREHLCSLQLVNFVSEVVGCRISLYGQLQLSDNLIADDDLQGYVADRSGVRKSALNLFDSKPRVFTHEILY